MSIENHIEAVREKIRAAISGKELAPAIGEEFISPNGQYAIRQTVYQQTFVSKIEVFDREKNLVSSLLIDDDHFFHHWILTGDKEYLLYAENMCGGNSVLNLKTGEIHSYSDGTDGFICATYYPSPDLTRLAVTGCYWACPYSVRIFDISDIESLPWPMLLEVSHKQDYEENGDEVSWFDEKAIRLTRKL